MKHTKEPWKVMPCPIHGGKHPFHDSRWIVTANAEIEHAPHTEDWSLSVGSLICQMRDVPPGTAQRIVECVNALAGVADPANAIAAAREALEALLSDYYATLTAYNNYREFTDGIQPVEPDPSSEMARAALALLEGVQP